MKDFKFNKQFGQNFLTDSNLLTAIVNDAQITNQDNVLEIGAGAGALTEKLCARAKKVVSFEIDKNLIDILSERFEKTKNLTLVFQDALKTQIEKIEEMFCGENFKVVANLPYYITTPLIFKFLEESKKITTITVMVQKEVAERITAKVSTPQFGTITPIINMVADSTIKRIVGRKLFKPVPNVDSAIIHIEKKKKFEIKNYEWCKKVVQTAFSMRRKTLVNNLSKIAEKEKILTALENLCLPNTVRGEAISTENFVKLSNMLWKK